MIDKSYFKNYITMNIILLFDFNDKKERLPKMAEELQGLLDRIQNEGLRKADDEKTRIINQAKSDAAGMVADAKSQAEIIIKNAENNAASMRAKAEDAIRQAARDVLIALKADILTRLQAVAKECVGSAMTPELMGQIILEMAKGYYSRNVSGDKNIELILSQEDASKMDALLKGALLASLQAKPQISVGRDFGAGLQIGFSGSDVFLDFSDEALSEIICGFTGPKLAAILKN